MTTRAPLRTRGLYGGIPTELLTQGRTLEHYGINAVWMGSGSLSVEGIALLKDQGARVYAEFNSMHEAGYVAAHPDAAPIGADGAVCPPPDGWQGVCPTHPGYRRNRMDAFRAALQRFEIDGIWLDYHHSHASWEQATPNMPDTCYCPRCLARFALDSGLRLPEAPVADISRLLACELRREWVAWRCGVYTDWVREYRDIVAEVRPTALLGTFHCPWSDSEQDGALRDKLAIDLQAQAPYLDIFSIMPYHARFGHADDPAWISRQVAWLGEHLGIQGLAGEQRRIWPIVQLSDWGETVPVEQVSEVLEQGACPPATGLMVFAWASLRHQPEKIDALARFYRSMA